MKKKILLSLAAIIVVAGGVAGMSAYEAHIINVTAHIENALAVETTPIEFGTVFPQEYLEKEFIINLSSSFLSAERVDDVDYVIKQKPKPTADAVDYWNGDITAAREWCHNEGPGSLVPGTDLTGCYLSLCPFLSKTDGDPEDNNDTSHSGYYIDPTPESPNSGDEYCESPGADATGRLIKSEQDNSDRWIVDLKVPPVMGYIGQDWPMGCPAVPENSQDYGCDLWIEVTNISLTPGICEEEADIMLVLDRSGSVAGEMAILKTAAKGFAAALTPTTDGIHMGQTSFATFGSLDLHLTHDTTAINAAIDALVSSGYTNLYEGILLADGELADPIHDRNDVESPDFMVIITDGFPNRPPGTAEADAIAAADAAKAAGVTIFVVGVGTTPETANWLRDNIATDFSFYFDADNWEDLQAILEGIASCNGD